MKIAKSYLVKLENGTVAWLAVGKTVENATVIEERPMIMPDFGKILRNKKTGEESLGHWLRDDNADDWEEIDDIQQEDK